MPLSWQMFFVIWFHLSKHQYKEETLRVSHEDFGVSISYFSLLLLARGMMTVSLSDVFTFYLYLKLIKKETLWLVWKRNCRSFNADLM